MDFPHLVRTLTRRMLRSPAIHYALLGTLLYAVVSPEGPAPSATRLVIPASRVDIALREYENLNGRPLLPEEKQAVLGSVVDQEVLYAYARRLGLDKEPVVERRLAQIATFVSENPHEAKSTKEQIDEAVMLGLSDGDVVVRRILIDGARRLIRAAVLVREPAEALLEEYLRNHPAEFTSPAQLRISHVLVDARLHGGRSQQAAHGLLARLRADAVPPEKAAEQGDAGLIAPNLPFLPERELERRFGHKFVEQLAGLSAGSWQGPISSRYGLHLVYIQERMPAHVPPLAEVRKEVRARLREKLADEWLKLRLAQLRTEFAVEVATRDSEKRNL